MGGSHRELSPKDRFEVDDPPNRKIHPPLGKPHAFALAATLHLFFSSLFVISLFLSVSANLFAAEPETPFLINRSIFQPADNNGFRFDTVVLRGKLHANGKPTGLTEVIHVPTGRRLDSSMGILSFYRVFSENKRYGTAAWDWPNGTANLRPDGAVEYAWPATDDRPFEFKAVYRWTNATTLGVEIAVTAKTDIKGFESFLANYCDKAFTTPAAYVAKLPDADKPGFLVAKKDAGDWQMFPRDEKSAPLIKDGRWTIEPNPVDWAIRPPLAVPLAVRRDGENKLAVIVMAPKEDCFAVAMPYENEGHYSLYLSLLGRDCKAGQTLKARARLIVAESISDSEIVERYTQYMKETSNSGSPQPK
ncbi:MAG: hypothetical protein GX455_07055 [Phycisphaerae bacterium]|nr:hypothetical protein [Phycisphaerae bacterium]